MVTVISEYETEFEFRCRRPPESKAQYLEIKATLPPRCILRLEEGRGGNCSVILNREGQQLMDIEPRSDELAVLTLDSATMILFSNPGSKIPVRRVPEAQPRAETVQPA